MSKQAVILCGGKGTRLKPYTVVLPKPLMPIGEFPILEVIVRQLKSYGFEKLVFAVNHQAELIKAFFGNGEKWGLKITYSLENKPLSTMGPLKLIEELEDNFLVMNGDILTDLSFSEFYQNHVKSQSIFTISSYSRTHVNDYGVLIKDSNSSLTDFQEKPSTSFEVSMGIYMANSQILSYIPENTFYGFDHLMKDLILDKKYPKIREHKGYWLDIGRPDDYSIAIDEFEKNKSQFLKN